MGFLDQKKKPKRKRRKKKQEQQESYEPILRKTPDFKHMISVKEELPPETHEHILVWGELIGWDVLISYVAQQHILYDAEHYSLFKIQYWYPLKEM